MIQVRFKPHPRRDNESGVPGVLIIFTIADQDAVDNAPGRRSDLVVFQRFLSLLKEVLGIVNGVLSDFLTLGKSLRRHARVDLCLIVVGLGASQLLFGINDLQERAGT